MNCGRSRNYFCIDALFDLLFVLKCSACSMPTLKSAYCKVETKPVFFFFSVKNGESLLQSQVPDLFIKPAFPVSCPFKGKTHLYC